MWTLTLHCQKPAAFRAGIPTEAIHKLLNGEGSDCNQEQGRNLYLYNEKRRFYCNPEQGKLYLDKVRKCKFAWKVEICMVLEVTKATARGMVLWNTTSGSMMVCGLWITKNSDCWSIKPVRALARWRRPLQTEVIAKPVGPIQMGPAGHERSTKRVMVQDS